MLRPDFPVPATWPAAPLQPTPAFATRAGGGGFPALMGEVSREVKAFIEDGSPDMPLSAEGRVWRLRAQAAGGAAVPGEAPGRAEESPAPGAAARSFLDAIAPWAREAGERLGVSPQILAAQAALESGWGQRPLRGADGGDTHNLFGLKAGAGWRGDAAAAATTEYEDGTAVKKTERFRSYPDHAAAFEDFTRLLLESPRYRAALGTGKDARAYAEALARGGYATDPAYADKLARIAARLQGTD